MSLVIISKDNKVLDRLYKSKHEVIVRNIYYNDEGYEITGSNMFVKPKDLCDALDKSGVIRHELTKDDKDVLKLALSYNTDFYYCNINYETTSIHIFQRSDKEF